jgi:hypothetical protein
VVYNIGNGAKHPSSEAYSISTPYITLLSGILTPAHLASSTYLP